MAMAEEESKINFQQLGQAPSLDDGTMEDILDKLKILMYDINFCRVGGNNFRPLSRTYFAVQSDSASNQFFYFTSLVSWLMTLSGHRNFPPPGQFDEPNAVSTNILQELKAMDIPCRDIAPTRLRQGHGDAVLTILSHLVDRALLSQGFNFNAVVEYPPSTGEMYQELENRSDAIGGGDDLDDRVALDSDSEDELYVGPSAGKKKDDQSTTRPQVGAEQWALEVERVGPMLQYRTDDIGDWRARVESAGVLMKAVEKMYPDVRQMLERMGGDLSKSLDRIQKREQTLAQQHHEHVENYRFKLNELNGAQDNFNQASSYVSQLAMEHSQVTEQLDFVKKQIEEREQKSSDTTPLMKIKDAVTKVKAEIREMSLRIGVLQHTVLHYSLRQNRAKREKSSANPALDQDSSMIENDFSGYM